MIMLYTIAFLVAAPVLFAGYTVSKLNEPHGLSVTLPSSQGHSHMSFRDDGQRHIQSHDSETMHHNFTETMHQNFTECDFGHLKFPGWWKDGVCLGMKEECCYENNIWVFHNFTACDASQTKRHGEWDLGYCHSNDISKCCGDWYNFTSCDESKNLEPWPNLWKDGVCSGFVEDCCYYHGSLNSYTFTTCLDTQRKIPEGWRYGADHCYGFSLYDCCGTPENVTSCNATLSLEPWPGMWKDGVCFGLIQECCYENDGFNSYFFPTCFESQTKIPGVWEDGQCFAHNVSLCCAIPQQFTRCEGSLEPVPDAWKNGACLGLLEKCCYERNSFDLTAYTSCPASQKAIPREWSNGECYAYNLLECCGTPKKFSICTESLKPFPDLWKDGACFGLLEECCYDGDSSEMHTFTSCLESQEKISDEWFFGECYGYDLEECCETPKNFTACVEPERSKPDAWKDGACFGSHDTCCSGSETLYGGLVVAILMAITTLL